MSGLKPLADQQLPDDLLALNHQSIDDQVLDGLRHHFTEPQIVELGWAAAAFIGFGRLIHVFGGR